MDRAERVGEKSALCDLRNGAEEDRVETHVEEKVQLSQDHQNDACNVQDSQPLLRVAHLLGHINSMIELRMLTQLLGWIEAEHLLFVDRLWLYS